MMNRYVIEREIPGLGAQSPEEHRQAAITSNKALAQLAPHVLWEHSYVTGDKMFCIYLAENEGLVKKHAELGGFPANVISRVTSILDTTSGN